MFPRIIENFVDPISENDRWEFQNFTDFTRRSFDKWTHKVQHCVRKKKKKPLTSEIAAIQDVSVIIIIHKYSAMTQTKSHEYY